MGMFFGSSGKVARDYGSGVYEEIESVYSRVGNDAKHNYWFDESEESDDE